MSVPSQSKQNFSLAVPAQMQELVKPTRWQFRNAGEDLGDRAVWRKFMPAVVLAGVPVRNLVGFRADH